jgi:hypothetical protein
MDYLSSSHHSADMSDALDRIAPEDPEGTLCMLSPKSTGFSGPVWLR